MTIKNTFSAILTYLLNKQFHRNDFYGEVIPQLKEAVKIREQ